jgi:hypothetical protein
VGWMAFWLFSLGGVWMLGKGDTNWAVNVGDLLCIGDAVYILYIGLALTEAHGTSTSSSSVPL